MMHGVATTASNIWTNVSRVARIDVSQEDSGNYTCEVRGPQSTLLGHVTHYLFVRGTPTVVCRVSR